MKNDLMITAVACMFLLSLMLSTGLAEGEDDQALFIDAPGSVFEGESFSVIVNDSSNNPVPDAKVFFDLVQSYTNESGIVNFTAPNVDNDTEYMIKATKDGYETAYETIIVKERGPPTLIQLDVIALPSPVTEESIFTVTVKEESTGFVVVGADVLFDGHIQQTNANGRVTFTAPEVEENTSYPITATHDNALGSTTIIVLNSPEPPKLVIIANFTVIERDPFTVTVKGESTEDAVAGVDVTFDGETNQTDANGQVNFTAPEVDESTIYTITATLGGYQEGTAMITVLNIDLDEPIGFVYGVVSSGSSLLENAQITITSGDKSWIAYTNEDGQYVQAVPPDIYTVEASKQGYETIVRGGITVEENEAMEANFKLVESTVSIEERESMAEYIVQIKIENGSVGAEIDATSTEHHVTLYSDLDIDVSKSNPLSKGNISFSVTGEGPGTIIVIYVTGVENENNVVLTYDGIDIRKTTDISGFFSSENTEESWIMLLGEKGEYVVLLNIPEWSEHSITISSLVSALGGPIVAVLYISISTIVLIVFLSPMITNIIRRRMHFRKKK